jgi:hypothetical protein
MELVDCWSFEKERGIGVDLFLLSCLRSDILPPRASADAFSNPWETTLVDSVLCDFKRFED